MNLTITPARTIQATNASVATNSAVQVARAPNRAESPFARSPREDPTNSEMAEVTVITVWRELQKSQKMSPEKRHAYKPASGGKPAKDASPNAAGSRYAARVIPARTSPRSQLRWYAGSHLTTGQIHSQVEDDCL